MTGQIGMVGTFDVKNFGDLLFPLLATHELRERLGDVEVIAYSHRAVGPPDWAYPVLPLERLPEDLDSLDLLLVGGGHIVRFDKDVAPGYGATSPDVHHPTGYWLGPTLVAAAAGVPVAWNAVGVSADPPEWAKPLLSSAVEVCSYLAVRDEPSADVLRELSPAAEISLVPDTAFGLKRPRANRTGERARALLDAAEVPGTRYAVMQANPNLRVYATEIGDLVRSLEEAGIHVVEVPTAPALGDRTGKLGVGRPLAFDPAPDPLLLVDLVAGAEAVIAFSLHLSIAAMTHGVPVVRPAGPPGSKWALLNDYENVHTLGGAPLAVDQLGRRTVEPAVADEAARVARHWDDVAALVAARRQPGSARLARLLTEVTTALEQYGNTISRAVGPPVRTSRPRLSSRPVSAVRRRLHSP